MDKMLHFISAFYSLCAFVSPHLRDWSGNALSLPGDGAAGAGQPRPGSPGLERRHGLRDAAGEGELLSELDVRASLCCKTRNDDING